MLKVERVERSLEGLGKAHSPGLWDMTMKYEGRKLRRTAHRDI
jgi:hypothetical protein